ncbi:hypothetical protein GIB67_036482 [Kingdonia uniflora]|uniref:Aminotransferase-like plant mobile domain-containing protein n=1 Tax=Kingdonia uniflora TaxID=39325 RepID=A0A7J7P7H6_9MAGN|nr:hypothetical protein GIB67_036482 [Kingdonia uniflora]
MLTSLSIGRYLTQVPNDDVWSVLTNARQLLPNIESNNIKSGNVNISHLRTYLTIAADQEDDITIVRTFILFMMGHLWFQTANDTVPLGYLAAVADLDGATQYDWGSAILASLNHGLDTTVTTGGAITGFSQLLEYWFYEYCGVGHPIVKEEEMRQVGFLDCEQFMIGEERETYASYWAEQTSEVGHLLIDSQRMGNIDLFGPTVLRTGIIPVVVTPASVYSLSQDFSLPGEAEGPNLGWHMEWTERHEMLPIACLWDPSPMPSSYGTEKMWYLTLGCDATRPYRVCTGCPEAPGVD